MKMPKLDENEVHLWWLEVSQLDTSARQSVQETILSASEVLRYASISHSLTAQEFLAARTLVRCTLSHYFPAIGAKQWEFTANVFGRPEVTSVDLKFNLSHSNGYVVLAVSRKLEIGVDLESSRRLVPVDDSAGEYFAPGEVRDLMALPVAERRRRFLQLWTLKEAYIKARGRGLSIPLADFAFQFCDDSQIKILFHPSLADDPTHWSFVQWTAGDNEVALAVRTMGRTYQLVNHGEELPPAFLGLGKRAA